MTFTLAREPLHDSASSEADVASPQAVRCSERSNRKHCRKFGPGTGTRRLDKSDAEKHLTRAARSSLRIRTTGSGCPIQMRAEMHFTRI